MLARLTCSLLVISALHGCSADEEVGSQGADEPIHTCVGSALRVDYPVAIDGEQLGIHIETQLPGLSCGVIRLPRIIECVPVESSCGFESSDGAIALEADFRAALAAFDGEFDTYDYSVIEECYCRVY